MKKEEFIAKYGIEAYERQLAINREWRQTNREYVLEKAKQYYQTNKEEISEYIRQYYQTHKEKRAEYIKQWHQDNKEGISDYNKQYYQENKEKIAEKKKQYYGTPMGRARNLLHNYNQADRIMNRGEGDLTADWIVENIFNVGRCHYCGQEFSWKELGCDRKDSSLPHTKDNCVPCCYQCNCRKYTKSYDEYKNALAS